MRLLVELVELRSQSFCSAAGVAEDDRRSVGQDPGEDLGVDARPDRRSTFGQRGRGRTGCELHLHLAERRHVLDRDHHLDLERLADAGIDDSHGALSTGFLVAAEEFGDLLERPLGGRERNALRWTFGDLLEPLQGHHQVSAPLGRGHRVDLVDDDRLDADKGLSRRRGEHQVERLGRGDQQIGRAPDQLLAVVGRRVAGTHPDLWRHEPLSETLGGELDALHRCAQVLLDVERQRPQRRDVEHPGAVRPLLGATVSW